MENSEIKITWKLEGKKFFAVGTVNGITTTQVADDRRAAIEKVLDALLGK